MKNWTLSLLLLALSIAVIEAAIIPSFLSQNDQPAYESSTDLITHCGDDSDLLEIKDITLNPDPPKAGEKLTVDFKGFLKEQVPEGSTVEVTVKYGVVQLIKKKFDFCQEADKVDEECPIEKGDLQLTKQVDLPKEIPPGRYSVRAVITTPEEKQVTCLDGRMSFPRHR
ncbi:ML domain-containing protein [Zychaea mexicana]|uniref:ML domain-containing protein n=1 Tax=Zychaea mexicana TaxID=64656 RepID=UPI0022FE29FE|nr:ML domain-containing protein [Zychaea mexicana]KAI9490663.1 ML domain-containing protein [Zychaea mexicana]